MDNLKYEKQECYGVLALSRCQGNPTSLFGSSIKHENTIRLKIKAAEACRELHRDRVYASTAPKDTYVEVELSYSQFAQMVTSFNIGNGVPVTIRSVNGSKMAPCPFASKVEQFHSEFEADLASLTQTADNAVILAESLFNNKKPLTKAEKEELLSALKSVSQELKSNVPYIRDCFLKQMDNTVAEAKGNIEGFIQNRINDISNAAVVQNAKLISENLAALPEHGTL